MVHVWYKTKPRWSETSEQMYFVLEKTAEEMKSLFMKYLSDQISFEMVERQSDSISLKRLWVVGGVCFEKLIH